MNAKWIDQFMSLAKVVATFSKDPDCKVGAIIVDKRRIIISSGYNGFPKSIRDEAYRLNNKTVKRELTLHAEVNAILNANADLTDHTILTTKPPCVHCALMVIQSDISMIVMPALDSSSSWFEQHQRALQLLREAGVGVVIMEKDDV